MSKIVGLRGLDGLGDDGAGVDPSSIALPAAPPARPAFTLAGVAMILGSMGLVGYIFWATLQKPKKSGFARNGRKRYRKRPRPRGRKES